MAKHYIGRVRLGEDDALKASIDDTKTRAKEALSTYLQGKVWDAYFTVTFQRPANYARLAIDRVAKALYPVRKAFVAAEPHKLGNYHVHGIAEFHDADTDADRVLAKFQKLGFSTMQIARSNGAVSTYCSKYITKELGDYEFLGYADDWQRERL